MHGGEATELCPDFTVDDAPEGTADFEQAMNNDPETISTQIALFILNMIILLIENYKITTDSGIYFASYL